MTISYSDSFVKLLLKWHGSLWKSIWRHLLIYLTLYYAINLIYRCLLNPEQKTEFLKFVDYCNEKSAYIPLNFLLGFFVSSILGRWWAQCNYISYPDTCMFLVTTYLQGEKYLILRRTIARWLNLAAVLSWRTVCSRTLCRFPTMDHVIKSGLMTEEELKTYESTDGPHGKWFLPLQWSNNLLEKCKDNNQIDSVQLKQMTKAIYGFRMGMVMLKIFEWVSIPLVYTQVVALATYGYFAITLVGRQITGRTDKEEPDIIVPIFTILQFMFYFGWFKVGEDLINPLGDDDDDFELNYVLDRNVQISYMLADQVNGQLPPLQKDLYWGQTNPLLPHTKASLQRRDKTFGGHLAKFKVDETDQDIVYDKDEFDAEQAELEINENAPFLKFRSMIRNMKNKPPGDAGGAAESGGQERRVTKSAIKPQHRADIAAATAAAGPPFDPEKPMSLYIDDSS